MSRHKYAMLILIIGIQLFQNSIARFLVSTPKVNPMGELLDTDSIRPKRDATLKESEISEKLQSIENDLKKLKSYGPLFIFFMSNDKRLYKFILMIMMYLFLFTFYYRKVRSHDETDTNSKIPDINSTDCSNIDSSISASSDRARIFV